MVTILSMTEKEFIEYLISMNVLMRTGNRWWLTDPIGVEPIPDEGNKYLDRVISDEDDTWFEMDTK